MSSDLILKNPHAVLAALQTRPKSVLKINAPREGKSGISESWAEVLLLAKKYKIPLTSDFPSLRGAPIRSEKSTRLSVYEARVALREPVPVEVLFQSALDRAQGRGIWLALDQLQDPQNVGAIFRTAAFFQVQGILLTQERSSPLTSIVYDVASGGVERVPFTTQCNLQRAFEIAKNAGLWILGTSEKADQELLSIPKDRPWLIVLGNEEKGMRHLTQTLCDLTCRIPTKGSLSSLNVSVSAGILMHSFCSSFESQ